MTEFRFYHLERRRIDQALPEILEDALAHGLRAVVQAPSQERVEALNERLWTYADESFLPHGAAGDGEAESQPIYLTAGEENPNGATLRVLLSGVRAAPLAEAAGQGAYECVILLFDGGDEEAKAEARQQWSLVKAAGAAPSYWREGEDGGWEKGR
ncbi:MAG TPA: DNA polymerase III subunit chi [Roseiarcus sp.]|nr:DNA polymerase III subunit chi [Roseiarcus sp.]